MFRLAGRIKVPLSRNLSQTVVEKRASLPRRILRWTFRGVGLGVGGFAATYVYHDMTSERSVLFTGQTLEYEKQQERLFGLPLADICPRMTFVGLGFYAGVDPKLLIAGAQKLIQDYPDIHIGYTLLGEVYFLIKDNVNSDKYLAEAHEVAVKNPARNARILELLPDKQKKYDYSNKPSMRVIQKDKLWVYGADVPLPSGTGCFNATAVVKRKDGSLVLVNPTHFDEAAVAWLKSLGPVSAIVTTTGGHGLALASASKQWPQAKLYGTEPRNKHDHPEVQWTSFLTDEKQEFGDELVHMQLRGCLFNETAFYHASSKSLLGITDLIIDADPWPLRFYVFGLGMTHPRQGVQAYMNAAVFDWEALRDSWKAVLKLDIDHMILGHGGQHDGREAVQTRIGHAYGWLFPPYPTPGWFERRVYLPIKFVLSTGVVPALIRTKLGL